MKIACFVVGKFVAKPEFLIQVPHRPGDAGQLRM